MELPLTITLILFFLLLEGFFSGSEFWLISFNRLKLRHMAESGSTDARIIEELLSEPDRIFGVTSIGTNVCVFSGAALCTSYLTGVVGERADIWSFLIMGPLTLIMGEIVPKIIFRRRGESWAPLLASPLRSASFLFAPLLHLTSWLAKAPLKIFLTRQSTPASLVTRDELLSLAREGGETAELQSDERRMIHRIFEFHSSTAGEVMTPLVNLVAISNAATIRAARLLVAESGYSRLPVFHDRIFNIVGVVSAFDILRAQNQNASVESIMTPPFYAPLTRRNAPLLRAMNENNVHMVVVVDEYGGSVGVVTHEDLVEEIIGEIEDEYDSRNKLYDRVAEGKYVVDAMMEIDALREELGITLPDGDYETVSGFLNFALERIPKSRAKVATGNYLITVLEADHKRASRVEILDVPVVAKEEAAG